MENNDPIEHFLACLHLLVSRAGGELIIEHFSELNGYESTIHYIDDVENDRVELTIEKKVIEQEA